MSLETKKTASIVLCVMGLASILPAAADEPAQQQAMAADLSSSERNIHAGADLFSSAPSASLNIGGETRIIQPGEMLTAAEYAALTQVLSGAQQSLALDSLGRATGGTFSLSSLSAHTIEHLVIPTGVTAIGGIIGDTINLTGNLINNGTLLALPGAGQSFSINSGFLSVGTGASISTTIPESLAGILSQSSLPINLSIFSQTGIVNAGSITASGILSVMSNGPITNALPQGITGAQPIMSGNLGTILQSATGIINNSGIIASAANLQIAASRDLLINNINGILSANNITISQSDSSFKGLTSVIGGEIVTQNLVFNGGDGVVKALVNEITGNVSVSAGEAHLSVATGNLNITGLNLTGDPTIVNSGGDIVLNPNAGGALRFSGMDLAILASGSVFAGPTLTAIDLSSTVGNGGSLTIAAGFEITPSTGGLTLTEPPSGPLVYTLGAPSATGGSIELGMVSLVTASSAGNGGNITLVAHDDNLLNEPGTKGAVSFGLINTASATGRGGNFLAVAQSGQLTVDQPMNVSGATMGGNVEIYAGEPEPSADQKFLNGTMSGSFKVKGDAAHESVVFQMSQGISQANNVTINVSGDSLIFAPILADGNVEVTARGGGLAVGNTINGTNISLGATGDILLQATIVGQDEVAIGAGGNITDFGSIVASISGDVGIFADGKLTIAPFSNLITGNDLVLASVDGIDIGNDAVLRSLGSTIMVTTGGINIGPNVDAKSGQLELSAPATGLLTYDDLFRFGGTFLLAEQTINLNSSLQSSGLDVIVLSRSGDINLAPGLSFTSHGGSIAMHAGGQVLGDSNLFSTRAAGSLNDFGGGTVELSSGFSFNPFVLSFGSEAFTNETELQKAQTEITAVASKIDSLARNPDQGFISPALDNNNIVLNPARMGAGVTIDNNDINSGLVLPVAINGGIVDVSGSELSMRRGAVVLTAVGPTSRVFVPNSKFEVESYAVFPTETGRANLPALVKTALTKDVQLNLNLLQTVFTADPVNQPTARHISLGGRLSGNNERSAAASRTTSQMTSALRFVGAFGFVAEGDTLVVDTRSAGYVRTETVNVSTGHVGTFNTALGITGAPAHNFPTIKVSENRSDLMLFTTTGQVLNGDLGGSRKASAIGSRGTAMSVEDQELVLHSGKIYADSGQGPMVISTVFGKLRLTNGASAAVISEPGTPSRVVALGGPAGAAVELTPASENASSIVLHPGEQAVIEMPKQATESGETSRMVIVKGKAPLSNLLAGESFNPGRALLLSGANRQAYDRLLSKLSELARQQGGGYDPARHVVHASGFEEPGAPLRMLATEGTVFQQDKDGNIDLHTGSLFAAANGQQFIKANHAKVSVGEGAMVMIESGRSKTRVLAFSGPGHTRVTTDDRTFDMMPGQDLLIQKDRPTKSDALPTDGIARRKMTFVGLPKGGAVMADFSIATALKARPYMKSLFKTDNENSRYVVAKIMKTHTVLELVTGKRGRFFMKSAETVACPDWIYTDDANIQKPSRGFVANK